MKFIKYSMLLVSLTISACSSLKLKPADFSWPIESVLKVDENGFVKEDRYSIYFNTTEVFLAETKDSSAYIGKEIRLIRDTNGYYYITSNGFKNVYIFNANDGSLSLSKKILISENGISKPALNQRSPYIELIEGGNSHLLSNEGIMNEEEDEE